MNTHDLCPICGEHVSITGTATDGRLIGSCGDAFSQARWGTHLAIGSRVREVLFGALDKARLTVKLTMCDDYPHGEVCVATVEGRWAEAWAEHDQTIAGDIWENCGSDEMVYAMPSNSATLVDELIAEGYSVDASEWSEPDYETRCSARACDVCYARVMGLVEKDHSP